MKELQAQKQFQNQNIDKALEENKLRITLLQEGLADFEKRVKPHENLRGITPDFSFNANVEKLIKNSAYNLGIEIIEIDQFKDREGNYSPDKYKEFLGEEIQKKEDFARNIEETRKLAALATNSSEGIKSKLIQSTLEIIQSEQFQRIQNGERNDALVASLQQNLMSLGYDLGKTGYLQNGVDGDYGNLTKKAIEDFNKEYIQEKEPAKVRIPGG